MEFIAFSLIAMVLLCAAAAGAYAVAEWLLRKMRDDER